MGLVLAPNPQRRPIPKNILQIMVAPDPATSNFPALSGGLAEPGESSPSRPPWAVRWSSLMGPAFLVCLFLVLTVATWRRWGDILIDLPLHLYTPWRLALGDVLYRDVVNLHGPFSETYHGLLFRIFGASVNTLIGASLVLLAAQTALLYGLFKKDAGELVATLIGSVFLVVFAFAHLIGIGNYNYILSYNYELIHGLFFSCCTLFFLQQWSEKGGRKFALCAGLFFGFAVLTKQEITLALCLAVGVAFILDPLRRKKIEWGSLASFCCAGMAAPAFFWSLFAVSLGPEAAAEVLIWPWKALLATGASNNAFHRAGLGLDDPLENMAAMIQAAGIGMLLLLGTAALCHRRVPKVIQVLGGILLLGLAWRFDWRDIGCGFPLFSLGMILFLVLKGDTRTFPLLWAVFGLGLLAKMGVNCRIWHYGYVLAMPTAIGLIFILLKTLPECIERHRINGRLFQGLMAASICMGTVQLWNDSWQIYRAKDFAFGRGTDTILTFPPQLNPRAQAIQLSVDWLTNNTPPQSTLAAFPQGVILNYLSRRANPTPYLTWIVTEYNTFGETRMLAALKDHPPDYIALVHTDTSEYGPRFFGQPGYGANTAQWIVSHYQPVFLAGSEPFRGDRFGIKLLRYSGIGHP